VKRALIALGVVLVALVGYLLAADWFVRWLNRGG
jgi:hypothetical protein